MLVAQERLSLLARHLGDDDGLLVTSLKSLLGRENDTRKMGNLAPLDVTPEKISRWASGTTATISNDGVSLIERYLEERARGDLLYIAVDELPSVLRKSPLSLSEIKTCLVEGNINLINALSGRLADEASSLGISDGSDKFSRERSIRSLQDFLGPPDAPHRYAAYYVTSTRSRLIRSEIRVPEGQAMGLTVGRCQFANTNGVHEGAVYADERSLYLLTRNKQSANLHEGNGEAIVNFIMLKESERRSPEIDKPFAYVGIRCTRMSVDGSPSARRILLVKIAKEHPPIHPEEISTTSGESIRFFEYVRNDIATTRDYDHVLVSNEQYAAESISIGRELENTFLSLNLADSIKREMGHNFNAKELSEHLAKHKTEMNLREYSEDSSKHRSERKFERHTTTGRRPRRKH